MQIDIDFDVFKALTVRREHENVSYNDVLRGLLEINLDSPLSPPVTARNNAPHQVDRTGLPWDERIHAKTKVKIADGTWRKRRGVDSSVVTVVEAELRDGRKFERPIKAFSAITNVDGYAFRGGFLPNGTKLKALYKNRIYTAEIVDGCWLSEDGVRHPNPSAAVTHITGTSSAYGHFWSAKRPGDSDWRRLSSIGRNL